MYFYCILNCDRGTSDLIITCQKEQLRIWATRNMKELKRHIVPNMTCNAIALACNGQAIVSGENNSHTF